MLALKFKNNYISKENNAYITSPPD